LTLLAGRIPRPLISAGFLSPAFAAIIYGLALRPRWSAVLEYRPLVILGDASYSLYLLHSTAFGASNWVPAYSWWLRPLVAFLAAVAVSLLSYYVVEEPCRKLLRPRASSPEKRDKSKAW